MEQKNVLLEEAKKNNNTIDIERIYSLNLKDKNFTDLIEFLQLNNIKINENYSVQIEEEYSDYFSSDNLGVYLKEISRYNLLSIEEEKELFRQYELGNPYVKEKIINSNLRLVVSIAKRFSRFIEVKNVSLLDLIQEGNLGLIKSIEKYKLEKGIRFSTYATYWITEYINRYIRNTGDIIRIPIHISEKINKLNKFKLKFYQKYNKYPSVSDISKNFGYTEKEVELMLLSEKGAISLDIPFKNDDGEVTLMEYLKSEINQEEEIVNSIFNSEIIEEIKDILSERELFVLNYRYGFGGNAPMTLEEIGKKINLTRERVRQIEVKAIRKIRVRLDSKEAIQKIK